jgi:hypothetical protein
MLSKLRIPIFLMLAVVGAFGAFLLVTGGEYPQESSRVTLNAAPAEFKPAPGTPQSPAQRTVIVMLFDVLAR